MSVPGVPPVASHLLGLASEWLLWLFHQLTVYLGKRDFMDQVDQVEPVGETSRDKYSYFSRSYQSWSLEPEMLLAGQILTGANILQMASY